MISPRKTADLAGTPVLFRLPNLHANNPDCSGGSDPADSLVHAMGPTAATAAKPSPGVTPKTVQTVQNRDVQSSAMPQASGYSTLKNLFSAALPKSAASESPQHGPAGVADAVSQHWVSQSLDMIRKRSAVLLAMALIACCSWIAGRHMAPRQAADTGDAPESAAPLSARDALQGNAAVREIKPMELNQPRPSASPNVSPALQRENDPADMADNDVDSFYLAEDPVTTESDFAEVDAATPQGQLASAEDEDGSASVASQSEAKEPDSQVDPGDLFAELSLDALTSPANQSVPPASEPVVEPEPSAPSSEQISAITKPADTDPESTVPGTKNPQRRRVFSRTPNDVPDWSRYLPGASESIRAASAEGPASTNQQAFYNE